MSWNLPFSRALSRFLGGYALLHLLIVAVFLFVITGWLRGQMLDQTRQRMQEVCRAIREHVLSQPQGLYQPELLPHIRRLAQDTGIRITLIADDGVVVADSETGRADIGDHGTRPEVLLAKNKDFGFNERVSATLQKRMMYLAMRLSAEPSPNNGFVRVAMDAEPIYASIAALQRFLWMFAIGLGLVAGGLMIVFVSREMRPLPMFVEAARNIAAGQYRPVPMMTRGNEWRSLSESFAQMQQELVRRESSLRENSLRLEAVLGTMIEGVIAIDQHKHVVLANQAACRMLGLPQPEMVGRSLFEVLRFPQLQEAFETAIATGQAASAEFLTRGPRRRTLNVRATQLSPHTEFGAAAVLYDVTELRQLETMRRDFVANVSHELKTPLASIKAYAETLQLGAINDNENNLEFVRQIESQADLLNRQIRDLIQLSRVESGQTEFDIRAVDLSRLVLDCRNRFAAEARQRNVSIDIHELPDELLVRTDREAIQTVLDNLLSNAIRYTKPDGVVRVTAEKNGRDAKIYVHDNGIGIAPDDQQRIFERFYRVDKARSRDVGGTGLGLAIVKHTLSALGGQIEVESRMGQGSQFTVTLPAD